MNNKPCSAADAAPVVPQGEMKRYRILIDMGEGGEKIIQAPDVSSAWEWAEEWTLQGDWCFGGEWADLWVVNVEDGTDERSGQVDISSVSYDSDKGEERPN